MAEWCKKHFAIGAARGKRPAVFSSHRRVWIGTPCSIGDWTFYLPGNRRNSVAELDAYGNDSSMRVGENTLPSPVPNSGLSATLHAVAVLSCTTNRWNGKNRAEYLSPVKGAMQSQGDTGRFRVRVPAELF